MSPVGVMARVRQNNRKTILKINDDECAFSLESFVEIIKGMRLRVIN